VSRRLSSWLVRLLGAGSIVCCLIVLASFGLFVVNQTNAASLHQRNEITGGAQAGSAEATEGGTRGHGRGLRRTISEAAETLTSPFAQLTSSWHSQWLIELVGTILALLLYGVVARYLMRVFQVRP
jgi:hypothetical protein